MSDQDIQNLGCVTPEQALLFGGCFTNTAPAGVDSTAYGWTCLHLLNAGWFGHPGCPDTDAYVQNTFGQPPCTGEASAQTVVDYCGDPPRIDGPHAGANAVCWGAHLAPNYYQTNFVEPAHCVTLTDAEIAFLQQMALMPAADQQALVELSQLSPQEQAELVAYADAMAAAEAQAQAAAAAEQAAQTTATTDPSADQTTTLTFTTSADPSADQTTTIIPNGTTTAYTPPPPNGNGTRTEDDDKQRASLLVPGLIAAGVLGVGVLYFATRKK
jgi:hypothetical protein